MAPEEQDACALVRVAAAARLGREARRLLSEATALRMSGGAAAAHAVDVLDAAARRLTEAARELDPHDEPRGTGGGVIRTWLEAQGARRHGR